MLVASFVLLYLAFSFKITKTKNYLLDANNNDLWINIDEKHINSIKLNQIFYFKDTNILKELKVKEVIKDNEKIKVYFIHNLNQIGLNLLKNKEIYFIETKKALFDLIIKI